MIRVILVDGKLYGATDFGLLKRKRRLVRVRFRSGAANAKAKAMRERSLRRLLPDVYERMRLLPFAPSPFPERIRAEWRDDEQAFVLHGPGMVGFEVEAVVRNVPDDQEMAPTAPERAVERRHGSRLPDILS